MKALCLFWACIMMAGTGCGTIRTSNEQGREAIELHFTVSPGEGGLIAHFTEKSGEVAVFCSEKSYIYVNTITDEGITINFIPVDADKDYKPLDFVVSCEQLGFMATNFNILQYRLPSAEG